MDKLFRVRMLVVDADGDKEELIYSIEENRIVATWQSMWDEVDGREVLECEAEALIDGKWQIWQDEDGWVLDDWLCLLDMELASDDTERTG